MIHTTPFIVVDIETTGLEPSLDRIVELAAVKVLNGEVVDEWSSLVNPGVFIPQETTSITGITSEMVEKAPRFEEVIDPFLNFLSKEGVFVAHNCDFDRTFINRSLGRLERAELSNPYLCTFKLAKHVHPHLPRYGLGNLAEHFGVELCQAHRALHDARATAELLTKFLRVLQNGGAKELKDIHLVQNLPKEPEKSPSVGQVSLF